MSEKQREFMIVERPSGVEQTEHGKEVDVMETLLSGKAIQKTVMTSRGEFTMLYPTGRDRLRIDRRRATRRGGIPADAFDEYAEYNNKDRQKQAGALLSVEDIARNQAGTIPANDPPPDLSNPDGQNQDGDKKAEQDVRQKITVDQYLKRAPREAGIGELVRSLYKTKIMSFEEWEDTVKALLKKQVR
jgi:hypothetical protein